MQVPNSSLAFWFGTEAELLKTFPIILSLQREGVHPHILATGQNNLQNSSIVQEYKIFPHITLNQFTWRKIPRNVIIWYFWTFISKFFKAFRYIYSNKISHIVVHGDTLSTLMGAIIGKISGTKIVHLEAGLRTFQWLNPFPEEIDRFIVGHLASIHFCQNKEAMNNVRNHKGEKILTDGNVIYDVVDMYLHRGSKIITDLPTQFSIMTFHRAESLYIESNLQSFLATLLKSAEILPTVFIMFEATREILEKNQDIYSKIVHHKNIIIKPRLPYGDFCVLMGKAQFIITDGGSNQEELAHIGTPTLIMRKATERTDGIGKNVVLSKLNLEIIDKFLQNYEKFNHKGENQGQPTKIITKYLLKEINIGHPS